MLIFSKEQHLFQRGLPILLSGMLMIIIRRHVLHNQTGCAKLLWRIRACDMRREDFSQAAAKALQSADVKIPDSIVMFTLDEPRYALYLSAVERVVRAVEITPLPKAPDIVLGIINFGGRVIPVLDIRKLFRLTAREMKPDDRFIIARTAQRQVAIMVDSVTGVHDLTEAETVNAKHAMPFARYLKGAAKLDGNLVLIHDLDQFLSIDEESVLDISLAKGLQ
jgi:purine-binding chemotaxis protein CheW